MDAAKKIRGGGKRDVEKRASSDICPVTGSQRLRSRLGPWSGVKNRRGKINSPTFAYQTVYQKDPPEFLPGRSGAPTKMWQGMDVDKDLKDVWLSKLNSLPVEIRSTEAGKSALRPAFVVFRMPPGKDDLHEEVVRRLKKFPGISVKADKGMQGRPRICVAGRIWKGRPGWEQWWNTLPGMIRRAYREATGAGMKKRANVKEVARVFKGQRFSDEDFKLGPRNKGWKVIERKMEVDPSGVAVEKTTRIRSFGRLKKVAFVRGFGDELEKQGFTLIELLAALGAAGAGGGVIGGVPGALGAQAGMSAGLIGGGVLGERYGRGGLGSALGMIGGGLGGGLGGALLGRGIQHLFRGKSKKKERTKKASFVHGFLDEIRKLGAAAMVVEPTPKKSPILEKNPFLRLQAKRKLVSGRRRADDVKKARGLLSRAQQFSSLFPREAS